MELKGMTVEPQVEVDTEDSKTIIVGPRCNRTTWASLKTTCLLRDKAPTPTPVVEWEAQAWVAKAALLEDPLPKECPLETCHLLVLPDNPPLWVTCSEILCLMPSKDHLEDDHNAADTIT